MSQSLLRFRSLLNTLIIGMLVLPLGMASSAQLSTQIAPSTPSEQAIALMERLTPEERVGQLFLVTFDGTEVGQDTAIYDLITDHHVGNVIFLAENDNLIYNELDPEGTINQALAMNRQLQRNEWAASQESQINPGSGEEFIPVYIPLLIGLSQEGDGYSNDQILHGLTNLPNSMAVGATWNPDLAEQVGNVAGLELTSIGFNLLLGPSLDVLEDSSYEGVKDLGTRSFGGDPYWVGEMGRAYIRGVHTGSQGQMAVVAKYFPGHGSSDRLPEEEVATVRKSLEQLQSFDLLPYFAVTGDASAPEEATDALLVSHLRYQGLQGNIRTTTRPITFDPQAFSLLMGLPPLNSWRTNGGLMVSDNLGSSAVRRFYDLTSQTFEARRVALNAFLAGNDMLYMADFTSEDDPDPYIATTRTLDSFAQKYREDAAFAQRVDESVLRILTLKYRLYGSFALGQVLTNAVISEETRAYDQIAFEVARESATLISPSQAELDDTIPDPPNLRDRIVFITDDQTAQQCSKCPEEHLIDKKALQEIVLHRYGPGAGGQVATNNLSSYSLAELEEMLDLDEAENLVLENDLGRANWIVFSMLDARADIPSYQVLKRFLSERPDLFQQKRLIVFAFNAPYFLDATNISKLTAFYGLYSKIDQFVDVAGYLLFRELQPVGAPPVSVTGIGYDLNEVLFPDPNQVIPLDLDLPQPEEVISDTVTPEPTPPPEFIVGDVIPLQAGVILDHNGNLIPDGTPVEFIFSIGGETNGLTQIATTVGGEARTTYAVNTPGSLEIFARSENALSDSLRFDIPYPGGETPAPTSTEQPTKTPPAPTAQTTPTAAPESTDVEATEIIIAPVTDEPPGPRYPELGDWVVAILISGAIAWATYRLAALIGQVQWGVRAGFLALIGGLIAYCYLVLEMPGGDSFLQGSFSRGVFLFTLAGTILGLAATVIWRLASDIERRRTSPREKT